MVKYLVNNPEQAKNTIKSFEEYKQDNQYESSLSEILGDDEGRIQRFEDA